MDGSEPLVVEVGQTIARIEPMTPRPRRDGRSSDVRKTFGRLLRKAREAKGMTQSEVGEKFGLSKISSQTYVSRIELGKANLTLDSMVRLAEIVGSDIRMLLGPNNGDVASPTWTWKDVEDGTPPKEK